MGLPGLRKAKESYNPIGYERKYMVLQKDFKGWYEVLTPWTHRTAVRGCGEAPCVNADFYQSIGVLTDLKEQCAELIYPEVP